jgi:hypothetical protein
MSYWEDATKRLRQELEDPLLRVEFNEATQQYEVLKWLPRTRHQDVPGFLFGSSQEKVQLGIQTGYYSVQMTFDKWDGRVFESMRCGRPDRLTAKEIVRNMKTNNEKVKKGQENNVRDLDREAIWDMHKLLRPTVYSYGK